MKIFTNRSQKKPVPLLVERATSNATFYRRILRRFNAKSQHKPHSDLSTTSQPDCHFTLLPDDPGKEFLHVVAGTCTRIPTFPPVSIQDIF